MEPTRATRAMPLDLVVRSSSRETMAVDVLGDVDVATVEVLRDALAALEDAPQLVVDLSATPFLDIAGVRALATCARHRRASGRELLVLAPPPSAEPILRMAPFCHDLRWVPRRHPASSAHRG
jgi:anti-anti-sigma factor